MPREENKIKTDLAHDRRGGVFRIDWLDAMKGFAILAVVLGHTLIGYTNNNAFLNEQETMLIIQKWIYTWHMPLFMATSGFAFSISVFKNNEINQNKLKSQMMNLTILYLIFSVTLGTLKILFSTFVDNRMNMKTFFLSLFFPNHIMWYLWVLIIFYLLFSKIVFINQNRMFVILISINIIGMIIADIFNIRICIEKLMTCAIYFYFGMIIEHKKLWKKRNSIAIKVALFIVFLYALILMLNGNKEFSIIMKIIFENCNAMAFIVIFFEILSNTKIVNRILIELGKSSLVIYLLHTYIVTIIKVIVIYIKFDNALIATLITCCIATIIPYIVYVISQKSTLIGYIFSPNSFFENTKKQ